MKKILIAFLLFLSLAAYTQPDSVISINEVVTVNGATQKDLFSKARQWLNNSFKDWKAVISIDDKESGELTGKGIMKINISYMGKKRMVPVTLKFRIELRVKDGKYKYEFTDFDVIDFWESKNDLGIIRSAQGKDWFNQKKWSQVAYEETRDEVTSQAMLLAASLKSDMKKNIDF